MDTHEALLTRRTTLAFERGDVPAEVVDRALRAAHQAPCHKLTWPWRFLVVGPRTRRALADLAVRLKSTDGELPLAQQEAIRAKMLDPGALVVVTRARHPDEVRTLEDRAAVAAAIQNLILSAHADGVGSKWSTGRILRAADTYPTLGVDPAAEEIEAFVFLGRTRRAGEVVRPPLEQHVRRLD